MITGKKVKKRGFSAFHSEYLTEQPVLKWFLIFSNFTKILIWCKNAF